MPDHQTSPVGEDAALLPCPFCGGTDTYVERLDYSAAYVQCDSRIDEHCACLARGPVGVQDDDGEEIPGAAAAIRAWNEQAARRAAPTQPKAQGSIEDYAQFHHLLDSWLGLSAEHHNDAAPQVAEAWRKFIAHIDAWAGSRAGDAAPDGWKLVPIEPTDDMIVAFAEQWYSKVRCIDDCQMQDCYAAMLAAGPALGKQAGNDQEEHNRVGKEQG